MDRELFTIVSHRCIRLWPLTCLWVPFLLHIPFSLPPPRELWGAPPQSLHGCTIPRVTPTPSIPHPYPVYHTHTQYTTPTHRKAILTHCKSYQTGIYLFGTQQLLLEMEELLYPHLSCYTFLLEGGDFSLVASQHQAQTQHIIFHSYGENSHASACFQMMHNTYSDTHTQNTTPTHNIDNVRRHYDSDSCKRKTACATAAVSLHASQPPDKRQRLLCTSATTTGSPEERSTCDESFASDVWSYHYLDQCTQVKFIDRRMRF